MATNTGRKGLGLSRFFKRGTDELTLAREVIAEQARQLDAARARAAVAEAALAEGLAKLQAAQRVERRAPAAAGETERTLRAKLDAETKERARLQTEVTRLSSTCSRQQQDIERVRAVAIRHGAAAYELPADSLLAQWQFDGRTAGQEKQRQAAAAEQAASEARQAKYEAERVERMRESERFRQERAARGTNE